ncbi:TonB-dependent receptor plug domain-containing protein [Falsigemmobacter faecalis]|uniref:TonB-dependent receptor n=1 Tax=Falsigemmobacter faecalis TaxID=2488730 RepID=A0A3P3DDK2_9RHOB|nr:TonB-dependent receptor [Falsigemmobacter faecalis]RRH72409.1 TonB-dependent receptor [Falsigemmobacter faecalis]
MRSSSVSYLALCAVIGLAQISAAAASDLPETVRLEEITLSASGAPVALSRTGASVTVLTAGDLKSTGNTAVAEQLARLPGLSMSRNGGIGTSTALRIRGLAGPYIGVRIDGIDVADPSGTQCSYDFGSTTSGNLSRIEVLRGSQSALYGSEAIGGVVDITTFRAEAEGTEAKVTVEAGSARSASATASVGVKTARGEFAFSASRTSTDGISAYAAGTEKDAFRASMLTFYGAYDLTEDLRLGLNGFLRDSYAEFDSQTGDNGEFETGRLRGGRVFAEARYGETLHELALSRVSTLREYPLGFVKKYEGDRDQLSWKGNRTTSDRLSLNWGADYTKETFAAGSDQGSVITRAVFGEVLLTPRQDLDISLALRRDDHQTFGTKTSGRAAAAWRPSEAWVIRAVASTGFRAPSLYELYSNYGNRDLKPETSRTFELGAEYLWGESAALQVTLFDTEIENRISFGRSTYEQAPGTTLTRGAEVTGHYAFTEGWKVFGNYTYTDAYTLNNGVRTVAVRVPRHDLALGVEGRISDKLSARASVHHVADFSDNGIWPAPASRMPDYTLVNASLGYQVTERTDVWLRAENLFNERYQTVRNYGQPGRQIFVGLSTRF